MTSVAPRRSGRTRSSSTRRVPPRLPSRRSSRTRPKGCCRRRDRHQRTVATSRPSTSRPVSGRFSRTFPPQTQSFRKRCSDRRRRKQQRGRVRSSPTRPPPQRPRWNAMNCKRPRACTAKYMRLIPRTMRSSSSGMYFSAGPKSCSLRRGRHSMAAGSIRRSSCSNESANWNRRRRRQTFSSGR